MNESRYSFFAIAAALVVAGPAVSAQAKDGDEYQTPQVVSQLYACQAIADDAERLKCFEAAVAAIQTAERERNLTFADRQQVREAKRGLFGLGNIRLGIFNRGDNGTEEEQLNEIEANVASITKGRDGKLLLRLEDGVQWAQIDTEKVRIRDLKSKKVKIKRGALGNYIAELDGGSTMRVRRIN